MTQDLTRVCVLKIHASTDPCMGYLFLLLNSIIIFMSMFTVKLVRNDSGKWGSLGVEELERYDVRLGYEMTYVLRVGTKSQ